MRRPAYVLATLIALVLVVGFVLRSRQPTREPAPDDKPVVHALRPDPRATSTELATSEPAAPKAPVAPAVDPRRALADGLASKEEADRIAAVEAARRSTATSTLPDLERFDLVSDPETAPAVIHAIAFLGASATDREREQAADTLRGWLDSEMKRDAPDARGNVSNMVEALGDLGGPNAVQALDAMLDRGDAAIHLQTLAVQKLGTLSDATARPSVERFAQRVAASPPGEGLDAELRTEAIQAAHDTLAKL